MQIHLCEAERITSVKIFDEIMPVLTNRLLEDIKHRPNGCLH